MTLTVSVFYIDELTGKFRDEISLPVGYELAGPEAWRNSVYGSQESIRLGLNLLCSLKDNNILAIGSDLVTLRTEVTSLLTALNNEYPYSHRLGNIIRACDLAIAYSAAVWIA